MTTTITKRVRCAPHVTHNTRNHSNTHTHTRTHTYTNTHIHNHVHLDSQHAHIYACTTQYLLLLFIHLFSSPGTKMARTSPPANTPAATLPSHSLPLRSNPTPSSPSHPTPAPATNPTHSSPSHPAPAPAAELPDDVAQARALEMFKKKRLQVCEL